MADFRVMIEGSAGRALIADADFALVGSGIHIPDNDGTSFALAESTNNYLLVDTTDAAEAISLGNATTNPTLSQLGSGQVSFAGNVDAANGLDVTTAALTAAAGLTVSGGAIDLDPTGAFALDMDATFTATVTVADNLANAWLLQEGANAYFALDTSDAAELMSFGNATTNPGSSFLGSGAIIMSNGSLDVPAGTSFKIGTTALTTANFTAANIDTLLDGSNADALHTHTIATATSLQMTGITVTSGLTGEAVYLSANDTVQQSNAGSGAGAAQAFAGIVTAAGTVTYEGRVDSAQFETSLTPAAGERVYVSTTTAGAMTNVKPSGNGEKIIPVGRIADASGYTGTLASNSKVDIILQEGEPLTVVA